MAKASENPLGLRIPALAEPKGELLDNPKELEAWIARLPMASGTATAKQLIRAIHDINRARIEPAVRIQIAELLTPPIEYAVTSLGRKYLNTGFPLSEKARRAAFVCIRLYEELAFSYKLAVHDAALGKIGHQERKILIVALFGSVRHLYDVILQSTLIYDPYPRHAWREMHNLFAFAETNRWAGIKVKLKTESGNRVTCMRDLYTQALLFAAASPYQLRQRQIRTVDENLPDWVEKIRLSAAAEAIANETCFIVQLKKDHPPVHAALVPKPISKPALELDTEELIQHLRERYSDMPASQGGLQTRPEQGEVGAELLDRLLNAWGTTPQRKFVRTRLNFELDVDVGLNRIHRRISGGNPLEQPDIGSDPLVPDVEVSDLNGESTFSSEFLDTESGMTLVPIENTDHIYLQGYDHVGMITQKEANPAPEIWQSGTQDDPNEAMATLRTINESAGGYCINWQGENVPGIVLGELVGVNSENNPSHHELAVARWMRNDPEQGMQVGLQLIAPNVFAVLVYESQRRKRTPTNCLLVPEQRSKDRPASLVAPVISFKLGDRLYIKDSEREQAIRLTRLIESTGAFAQFQFAYD